MLPSLLVISFPLSTTENLYSRCQHHPGLAHDACSTLKNATLLLQASIQFSLLAHCRKRQIAVDNVVNVVSSQLYCFSINSFYPQQACLDATGRDGNSV